MKQIQTMTKSFSLLLISCITFSCVNKDTSPKLNSKSDSAELIELSPNGTNKNIRVSIKMDSYLLEYGEAIKINLEVKNQGKQTIKLLFENPNSSFGPWATSGMLIDSKTKSSKLKYSNRAVLQSSVFSDDELKDRYVYLKPDASIRGRFNLTDIVVLLETDQILDPGVYTLQLYYYSVPSNKLEFRVK